MVIGPPKNAGQIHGKDILATVPSNNMVLKYNSATKKWGPANVPAAGSDKQVQFNNAGDQYGAAGLEYDVGTESLTVHGGTVINEDGYDQDTRIEGDTDIDLIHVDASADAVGIGVAAPSAKLHLKAGTATKAPLKFTAGTNLTTPEAGTIEFDGTDFFMTV